MKVITKRIKCSSRADVFRIYTIGDVHLGKLNCCEQAFRRIVKRIADDDNAVWVGGGDIIEAIKPGDAKRWDSSVMADWMLDGGPQKVRDRMRDVTRHQVDRALTILHPIKDKCIGMIEGNHEFACRQYYNSDVQGDMCGGLGVPNLTDCAFVEFFFLRKRSSRRIIMFVAHGNGGGRAAGSEPNHLARMLLDKDCDIAARGHSHTFHILPPVPRMIVKGHGTGNDGRIGQRVLRAYNWGCYVLSYPEGPSLYETRGQYPARPLTTACFVIQPHWNSSKTVDGKARFTETAKILIEEIDLAGGE